MVDRRETKTSKEKGYEWSEISSVTKQKKRRYEVMHNVTLRMQGMFQEE